ncbi:unnamed protein product [Zymoseptoria tritici ST99CH_3D7]|uniref:BRCT domain-containing protein n=2 Tax=Zymoseptoria tritici TaxID=1047171 RepID=A0A1X7RHI8_ZYMT9|nr:unnamed protein product [Zymoseptoria tritici ST99CH_3D7]SMR43242.1 unnamed protein product [Zymoseptoria tritici ST99CH_1E4]
MEEGDSAALFGDVVFTVIPSDDIEEHNIESLKVAITNNGGRFVPLRASDQHIEDLEELSHIITTHVDFPQYDRAIELGTYIVKPAWVALSIQKQRQASTRQYSPDPSQFFHDVVATFAGLPESDEENLTAGVIALGGQKSTGLSKLVTHIVTTNDNEEKCRLAKEKQLKMKRVLPHWFDDCLRLGRKINEQPYMFPDPEILRSDLTASTVRGAQSPELDGATTATPSGEPSSTPPSSPSESRKNLNALTNRTIFLSDDLHIEPHLRKTLDKLIHSGGGAVVDSVKKANVYIGAYRDGSDFIAASRKENIEVANLAWLFHVINRNKYVSPLRRLLHYPIPRRGLPGFENMKISISNYSGDARLYVENLIRYCGAEYTKTMKQDNTHVIAAHLHGEKCEAAQEWNINMVNHLWLEESYAKCAVQSISNPKYVTFPTRTNLGEVAGQTSLDMKAVERLYYPLPRSPQKPQKAAERQGVPASSAFATTSEQKEPDVPEQIDEDDEMDVDNVEEPQTAKRPRGRPPKSALATPRVADDEKENESPFMTSTGRASKVKALNTLHSQAADIELFQKEMKRKGGVIHGGRRGSIADEMSSPAPNRRNSRKRPSDEYDVTAEGSALSDGETQHVPSKLTKKAKHAAVPDLPEVRYRMMVTGDDRWASNARKESADKNTLRSLGVLLTSDPKNVDILVAPKLLRTRKFVCALACAPLVVDTTFLDSALKHKKLAADPPMLKDREGEQRLGYKLADALERAKLNNRKLFRGWSIFVTKDVNGGFDTYKDIITLNGGVALLYTGRTGITLPKRQERNDPESGQESQNQGGDDEFDYVYLVSGGSEAEVKLWKTFRDTIGKQQLKARIVQPDWLLHAAMTQQIIWKDSYSLDEGSMMSQRSG